MNHRPIGRQALETSRDLLEKAGESLAKGEREEALARLDEAFRQNPSNDELPLMAAMILQEDGNFDQAAEQALAALEIRPWNPAALNLLGVICMDAGRPESAQGLFRRVIRLAPGHKVARRNLKDARKEERRLRRSGGSSNSRGRASFPDEKIRSLKEGEPASLTVCVLCDGENGLLGDERVQETLEPFRSMNASRLFLVKGAQSCEAPTLDGAAEEEVHPVPWGREPADLFNYGLSVCRTGWILFLNAGEKVGPRFQEVLAERLSDREAIAHPVAVGPASPLRLVRNLSKIVFLGTGEPDPSRSVAELCRAWRVTAGSSGLVLEPAMDDRDGPAAGRNEDLKAAWALVREKRYAEALDRSTRLREEAEALSTSLELEVEGPATVEGYCLMRLERFQELRERMERFSCRYRPTTNTLFLHGMAVKALGDSRQAEQLLRTALDRKGGGRHFGALPEAAGAGLPNILGAARIDLGDFEGAANSFEAALGRDPANMEAALGMLVVHAGLNRYEQVLQDLDSLITSAPNNGRVWSVGATVLEDMPGMGEAACSWLEEAVRRFPERGDLRNRLAAAYLTCGQGEKALEIWDGAPGFGSAALACRVAAGILGKAPLPEVPGEMAGEVTGFLLGWMGKWMQQEAYEPLDQFLANLDPALERLPGLGDDAARWLETVGQPDAAAQLRARFD